MSATEAPERIGPYRLIRRLGEGGMGVVHLALDPSGAEVAVKVLHPHVASDLKARDRLIREVDTMRRVRSDRVAAFVDADLTGPTPYVVTKYAPGRTLEDTVLEDGPLPDDAIIRLACGLCEALVAIHAADVIHRDLKPANVILVDGDPVVIDFGIAHLVNATRLTQTGMFVGTPGYLAPEIIRGAEITQAADIHALGGTVFFAATGQPPFGSGAFEAVCYNILEGKPQLDLAPAWLRGWLRLALAKEAADRPTAAELLRLARKLDPTVVELQEQARDGSTKLLDASTLGETKVLGGTRAPDDFSDLLTPVNYVTAERAAAAPAAYAPPPAGHAAPPAAPPRPPFQDQRVAGPPFQDRWVAGHPGAVPPPRVFPPPAAPPAPPAAPPWTWPGERAAIRERHPMLAALLLVILVALACMVPVTVSLFAIVATFCLRVGYHLFGEVSRRRAVRGSSITDPFFVIFRTPWAVVKSGLATLVHVPLAAMFAMCVWGVLTYIGRLGTDPAAAYAAGAFVAGLFILPGGAAPRAAVSRTLSAVIRTPGAARVLLIVAAVLALFTSMIALSADAHWAPWRPPTVAITQVVSVLKRKGEDTVVNLISGVIGDIMDRIGLSSLTFWN